MSQVLPPLTIVEGMVMDFNLHFRIACGEFLQTHHRTDNRMNLRTPDTVRLGSNDNLQGGMRYYNLDIGWALLRTWNDCNI